MGGMDGEDVPSAMVRGETRARRGREDEKDSGSGAFGQQLLRSLRKICGHGTTSATRITSGRLATTPGARTWDRRSSQKDGQATRGIWKAGVHCPRQERGILMDRRGRSEGKSKSLRSKATVERGLDGARSVRGRRRGSLGTRSVAEAAVCRRKGLATGRYRRREHGRTDDADAAQVFDADTDADEAAAFLSPRCFSSPDQVGEQEGSD